MKIKSLARVDYAKCFQFIQKYRETFKLRDFYLYYALKIKL